MSNIRYSSFRPSSCKFRHASQVFSRQQQYQLKRPTTAHLSSFSKSKNDHLNESNMMPISTRPKVMRAIQKESDCKSIFATDLRFILEQQNIRSMNIQLSKFFKKDKAKSKHQAHRSNLSRQSLSHTMIKTRPTSALNNHHPKKSCQFVAKNIKTEHTQNFQTLNIKENLPPKTLNEEQAHTNVQQFDFCEIKRSRKQTQNFIRKSKSKFSQLLIHFQQSCYQPNPSYQFVKQLGDQFVSNDLQLVQKSIYQPKQNLVVEDLEYYGQTINKIQQIQLNIIKIMNRPRTYHM